MNAKEDQADRNRGGVFDEWPQVASGEGDCGAPGGADVCRRKVLAAEVRVGGNRSRREISRACGLWSQETWKVWNREAE